MAIVGGGITGVTLAWTLAEQGATVAMLEGGRIAGEASGRNAGFLLAIPAEPYAERIALWGRDGARALLQIGRRTHRRIAQLAGQLRIDCDYRLTGSLRLTRSEEETEDMRGSLPELRHDGFPMRELSVADVMPPHARAGFHGAFEVPEDGVVHPVHFLYGLAADAIGRGARLHEASRVSGARWKDGVWECHANGHIVRARAVVLATNAWAPELIPALKPLIMPRRGQMVSTAPLDMRLDTGPSTPTTATSTGGDARWPAGDGGWRNTAFDAETGYDSNVTPDIQGIERGIAELVPRDDRHRGRARWDSRAMAARSWAGSTPRTTWRSARASPGTEWAWPPPARRTSPTCSRSSERRASPHSTRIASPSCSRRATGSSRSGPLQADAAAGSEDDSGRL